MQEGDAWRRVIIEKPFGRDLASARALNRTVLEALGEPKPTRVAGLNVVFSPSWGRTSRSGGWPSGHATLGMIMALTLSMMVPEKRPAILARAVEYGRLVAGIHFRSAIEMGRIAEALIALEMMRRDEVKSEYELARGELRDALGNGAGSAR